MRLLEVIQSIGVEEKNLIIYIEIEFLKFIDYYCEYI